MPEKGGSTKRTRVHSKDRDYTLYTQKRNPFTILTPVGRYNETLLGKLAQDFLQKPGYLAVDLSKLDAVSLPLVRAFCDYAAGLEQGIGRLVLLRPPDKIMGLVRLVGRLEKIPVVLSEGELEGDLELLDDRVRRAHERVRLVRTMLQSNPCWQLVAPDANWLCPFCVTFRPEIQFVAQGSPTQQVVERIANHLARECSTYAEGATDGWPFEVLERIITHAVAERAEEAGKIFDPPPKQETPAGDGPELGEVDERRRRLLPTAAATAPNCDTEVCYRAAEAISGDFYDFVRGADRRLALVVGDVSGSGIEPGVLMGMARKTISIRLREHGDPAEALARANDDLCSELEGESFVTAVVAIIDGARREVTLARAGHVAPFLVREGTPRTVERLESAGPVLGLVPTAALDQGVEVRRLKLKPGDVLVLHSDGLEELKNEQGESFGADRIAAILRANAHLEASMILGAVIVEAEQFSLGTDREEDITAICARFV